MSLLKTLVYTYNFENTYILSSFFLACSDLSEYIHELFTQKENLFLLTFIPFDYSFISGKCKKLSRKNENPHSSSSSTQAEFTTLNLVHYTVLQLQSSPQVSPSL